MSNSQVRRELRFRRRSLDSSQLAAASLAVCDLLESELRFPATGWTAAYSANDGEVDLAPFLDASRAIGRSLALPVIQSGDMAFSAYSEGSRFVAGRFGILEPRPVQPVCASDIHLVLVPLVACSPAGDRLGRGGGYYDRFLQSSPQSLAIGIGHSFQCDREFDVHERDAPLDAVITEQGIQWFQRRHESRSTAP